MPSRLFSFVRLGRVLACMAATGVAVAVLAGPARSLAPAQDASGPGPTAVRPAAPLAFVDVSVLPMDSERVLARHTVLVRDGRIEALGPSDQVTVPDDATRVDGRGRFLMPGLVDMHVHTWFPGELVLFVAHGVTTVRNMFGSPQHLRWRADVESGETFGPHIVTAGPIVDGQPPVWPGSRVLEDAEDGAAVVREQTEAGYDFVKLYSRLTQPAYDAVATAAREQGLPFSGHVTPAVSVEHALQAGQRSIEHLTGYETWLESDDSPVRGQTGMLLRLEAWAHPRDGALAEAAAATARAGTYNCPTLVVMDRFLGAPDDHPERSAPSLRYVSPMSKSLWRGMSARWTDSMRLIARSGRATRMALVAALQEAGAPIVLGTDTGNPYVVAGVSVHQELELLVQAGLSPYDALSAATRVAAECLGSQDSLGTVGSGKRADLLLLEANPLEDVGAARRIAGTMVAGRWHPQEELAERLEQLAARNSPGEAEPVDAPEGEDR